jgi:hypothetical protein
MLRFFNGILDPGGYFFLLLTSRFLYFFVLLIFKCIYNFPSFQSYTHLYIETRELVSYTGEIVLYLRTQGKLDVRIIHSQEYFRMAQDLNRVER